jgi:hypothetical protein
VLQLGAVRMGFKSLRPSFMVIPHVFDLLVEEARRDTILVCKRPL